MKNYAQIHLQLSNLQYDKIPLKRWQKRCFFARFSQRFNGISSYCKLESWR